MYENIYHIKQILGPDAKLVLVGGTVRDLLLNRDNCDWDLATALLPQEVIKRSQIAGVKVIPTGLKHGTVTLIINRQPFEVTTFRGDGVYLDGRHPESVNFGVSLEQDLARRDFTINAMALPTEALVSSDWTSRLIDPFGGRADLKNGIIKAVGDPLRRFQEDGLRVLRACRFSAMLGFKIDETVLAAIPKCLPSAEKISIERVFVELTKTICAKNPDLGLLMLADTKLLALWLPELCPVLSLHDDGKSTWEHTLATVKHIPSEAKFRWAALLHNCGKCVPVSENVSYEILSLELAKKILARMRASNSLTFSVLSLLRYHNVTPRFDWSNEACRRFLRQLLESKLSLNEWATINFVAKTEGHATNDQICEHNALLTRLRTLAASKPPLTIKDLAITSQALMNLAKRKGGLWLRQLQEVLLEEVLKEPNSNEVTTLKRIAIDWLTLH